jgi:hypothetical protein
MDDKKLGGAIGSMLVHNEKSKREISKSWLVDGEKSKGGSCCTTLTQ